MRRAMNDDGSMNAVARSSSTLRRASVVLYGIVVSVGVWWLTDELANQRFQRLDRAESALVPLIALTVVAAIATAALYASPLAAISAAATTGLGIVLGGYGARGPLVTLPSDELQFTLLRGAYEPTIWVLGAVWAVIAILRLRGSAPVAD